MDAIILLYLVILKNHILLSFLSFPLFFSFVFFRGTSMAYGGSQARGRIRAVATGHSHSHTRSELHLHLQHSSQHCWILNPLSEARDYTRILVAASRIRYR